MKRSAYLILIAALSASFFFVGCSDDDKDPETDAVDTTEEDGTADAEEEVELITEDACISEANEAALTAFAAEADCDTLSGIADENSQSCGALTCLGDPNGQTCQDAPGCMADAVQEAAGVDVSCANCAGEFAACVINNCAGKCAADTSAPDCQTCIAENCAAGFQTCTGFSVEDDTCETYAAEEEGEEGGEEPVKQPAE